MTRGLLVVALALVGCGGGARSLRLPTFTPTVEQKTLVDEAITIRNQVHAEDGVTESRTVIHRRTHRRVTELEGALVVRQVVHVEVDETTKTDSGGVVSTVPGALAGKRYELWRDRDALEAQHSDGTPITAEERAALNAAYSALGTTSRWEAFLNGRTWKRDEVVELPRDLSDTFALGTDADVQSATIAWTRVEGAVATFRATLTLTSVEGFEIQMTNDTRIDRRTGYYIGDTYKAIIRGTTNGISWVQDVEAVTTYEAE